MNPTVDTTTVLADTPFNTELSLLRYSCLSSLSSVDLKKTNLVKKEKDRKSEEEKSEMKRR